MSFKAAIVAPGFGYRTSAIAVAGVRIAFAEADAIRDAFVGLGSAASETWVLSSSAEDVDVALGLGLHVCAVLPEGVATAQGGLEKADVIAHGWREVTFALLDDYESREEGEAGTVCRVLIVSGSPVVSPTDLVRALADEADYVVACDSGAMACRAAGVKPDAFVGDGDSADADTLAWVRSVADRCISFPPEKYATDLALAIDAARHEAARRAARLELTLTCSMGGRPDHALAVVGQLAKAQDVSPRIVEKGLELRILSPGGCPVWKLGEDALDRTLSIVALAPDTVASERGLRWELSERELPLLGDEGISNVVTHPLASVECHSGVLAVYLLHG